MVVVFLNKMKRSSITTERSTGTIFRLKGSILTMCFLDWTGALIKSCFESWRDAQKEKKDREC